MPSESAIKIGAIANAIIKNSGNVPNYITIFSDWKKVVGENVASIAVPHKVTNVRSSKILILKAVKGHALKVQHESAKILQTINNFLGSEVFSNIKVIQVDLDTFS